MVLDSLFTSKSRLGSGSIDGAVDSRSRSAKFSSQGEVLKCHLLNGGVARQGSPRGVARTFA